jgi:hypothetical protein
MVASLACAALAVSPATTAARAATNPYNVNGGNLAGAYVSGSGFYSVTSTWTEPSVTCNSPNGLAIWVGLDGFGSSTIEQTGVAIDCSSGRPAYQAWYEVYPAGPVYYSTSSYPVAAGDRITGTVTRSGSTFTLKIADATRGWTRATTTSLASASNASAEIVLESGSGSLPPFGTVYFTNSSIDGSLLANWNPVLMDASDSFGDIAHTSAVSGGSFSITYLRQ